jgi:hypothetical protein
MMTKKSLNQRSPHTHNEDTCAAFLKLKPKEQLLFLSYKLAIYIYISITTPWRLIVMSFLFLGDHLVHFSLVISPFLLRDKDAR